MTKQNDLDDSAPFDQLPPGRLVISNLSTEVAFQSALMKELAEYDDLFIDEDEEGSDSVSTGKIEQSTHHQKYLRDR